MITTDDEIELPHTRIPPPLHPPHTLFTLLQPCNGDGSGIAFLALHIYGSTVHWDTCFLPGSAYNEN